MKLITKELCPVAEDEAVLHIDVRRKFVLQDALREGRKNKFTTKKDLKVSSDYSYINTTLEGSFEWYHK